MNRQSTVQFSVPYGGSKNKRFTVVRGRLVLTAEYRATLEQIGYSLKQACHGRSLVAPLHIQITLRQPDKRKRDASNLVDVVCDAVSYATGIDDSLFSGAWDRIVDATALEPSVQIRIKGKLI